VVLLGVVPLVWSTGVTEAFRTPQRELTLATLSVLAAAGLAAPGLRRRLTDGWSLAWAGVLAAGAVAALACPHPTLALAGLVPLLLAALASLTLRELDETHRRRLRTLIVLTGVVQAGLAVAFSTPGWRPAGYHLLAGLEGRYAWIGTLGNPGWVGVYLVLPALLAAVLALAEPRRRVVWAAAAVALAGAIVATRTITALAALVFGLAVMLARRLSGRQRLTALAVLVVVTAAAITFSPLRSRVRSAAAEVTHGGWRWAASGRGVAVQLGAAMLAAHPFAGVGPGRFEAEAFAFADEDTLAERGQVLGLVTGFGETHNDVLQFAAEHGAVGIALALAGLVLAWRRRTAGSGALPDSAAFLAAATLLALTQFPLHHSATAAQWLVLASLALPRLRDVDASQLRDTTWWRVASRPLSPLRLHWSPGSALRRSAASPRPSACPSRCAARRSLPRCGRSPGRPGTAWPGNCSGCPAPGAPGSRSAASRSTPASRASRGTSSRRRSASPSGRRSASTSASRRC
jgi:O-antigen ligase